MRVGEVLRGLLAWGVIALWLWAEAAAFVGWLMPPPTSARRLALPETTTVEGDEIIRVFESPLDARVQGPVE